MSTGAAADAGSKRRRLDLAGTGGSDGEEEEEACAALVAAPAAERGAWRNPIRIAYVSPYNNDDNEGGGGDDDDDLRRRFQELWHAIQDFEERFESGNALLRHLELEVGACPELAAAVSEEDEGMSLLNHVCHQLFEFADWARPSIQFLIDRNPHVLTYEPHQWFVWGFDGNLQYACPMHWIANSYPDLMPAILEHHAWTLDHPVFRNWPAHYFLLDAYFEGRCDASLLRRFFGLYPQGLRQQACRKGGVLPIHRILNREEGELDVDLIKWMASHDPPSLLHQDGGGCTPLYEACNGLAEYQTADNMMDLCCFLIKECPASVRLGTTRGTYPIHRVAERCHQPAVQQVVLAILREHPESAELPAASEGGREFPSPSTVPFIQRVAVLLQEERVLQEDAAFLVEAAAMWHELAPTISGSPQMVSVTEVFLGWANQRAEIDRLIKIPKLIQEVCRDCEGEDPA